MTSEALALLLLVCVALPLLVFAAAVQAVGRTVRTVITAANAPAPEMADPFRDCPPQPVVYECRHEQCSLQHEQEVNRFATVEDHVAYYCRQGHQAQAVFPAADDATWPPEGTTTEWHQEQEQPEAEDEQ